MTKTAPRAWYRLEVADGEAPAVADIHIIDFIGDWIDDWFARNWDVSMGVTARAFVEDLAKLPASIKTLRVHINSPGGDVFAAQNIANALRDQHLTKGRTVETIVDGLAASAASIIMMAGTTVRVADTALVMIHNPWTVAVGNAAELTKAIGVLDKVRDSIVGSYRWHSTLDVDAIKALMDAETWMDADEALAHGFATEKVEGLKAAASISPRAAAALTVPDKFRARVEALLAKEPPPAAPPAAAAPAAVLKACREGGCLELAEGLIAEQATPEQVQARVTQATTERAAATERASQIRAACDRAKLPELAAGYIAGAMPLDAVKAQLVVLTAKLDRVEIDGGLPPDHGTKPRARINVSAVYADLNRTTSKKE